MMLSDEELQRRKPLWTALSDLWLDTEISPFEIDQIARIAISSGYSIEKLNEIYLYEVAPVVSANLHVVAGVWMGFDEEWLHTEAQRRAESRSLFLRLWAWSCLGRWYMTYATEAYWQEIIAQVQATHKSLLNNTKT